MVNITGTVEGIIYRNDENGYTVFVLSTTDNFETVTGTFPLIREGDFITVFGLYVEHEVYGTQFKATSYEMATPKSIDEIEIYLSSGIIKGIGPKTARDIVDYFGTSALDIIEKTPEKLRLVQGIGAKKLEIIKESYMEIADAKRAVMFLQKYGVNAKTALKIFSCYADQTVEKIQENPYRLVSDVDGIGFLTADKIAGEMGIEKNSKFRINAGIIHCLNEAGAEGHTYLPETVLINRTAYALEIDEKLIKEQLLPLASEQTIIMRDIEGVKCVYHPSFFYAEAIVAGNLIQLAKSIEGEKETTINNEIDAYEKTKKITLAKNQREAVISALNNGITVITGGPGTGKTTALDCILHLFRKRGVEIALAAPTGRAAKRMANATGEDAKTIHRLLEYTRLDEGGFVFKRNKDNPINASVCIVDEASMIDIFLMQALLEGLKKGTRLILVGDSDQLASVGAGNVLGDIIASETFLTVRLNKIFRQAEESAIITNAHKINNGINPVVNIKGGDFFLDRRISENEICLTVVDLVKNRLPNKYGVSPFLDIQVLTPVKKGATGVFNLNKILQQALNPAEKNKKEHIFGENIFRVGDKVMQIRNNYDRLWQLKERFGNFVEGTGVFNGDSGIIKNIDVLSKELVVHFDDGRISVYNFADLEELTLSYAISVHKSQGCEFPIVVMPLPVNNIRIMTRNLLYTAVTRAKKLVVLCGNENTINYAVNNIDTQKRYSALDIRLKSAKNLL
ncbi:MAG: ATP-dependent RecD-like DNA helicase [Clostridiales bacterium]|nr:ATP-dependent RecD-like DNA helicase [Clostridiales bacterium]